MSFQIGEDIKENLTKVLELVDKQEAQLVINHTPGQDVSWAISLHWGQEAPDSPMFGAAAYGTGEILDEALSDVIKDARL